MEHRLGTCPVGEASVGIAISSAHRKEALEATHYAIDAIKANVPIWKKVRNGCRLPHVTVSKGFVSSCIIIVVCMTGVL